MRLLLDRPLGEDSQRVDGLGFEPYARAIGEAVVGADGPLTVGVFGEWGSGKSSLMGLVARYIETHYPEDVITIWFNVWRYEREEHPIVPMLATILARLEEEKSFLKKLPTARESLTNALRAMAFGFSANVKGKVPGLAEADFKFSAKDAITRAEALAQPVLDSSLYYNAYDQLNRAPIPEGHKVVVIIDDLDRCLPAKAIELLESLKLVLSQPGFVFLLGVSRAVLEGYLDHRYMTEFGIEGFEGRHYLDKIVQLPFYIPSHEGRMERFTDTIIEQLGDEIREDFKDVLPIISTASGANPRTTIRFVNNLLIDQQINDALAERKEMERIPLAIFAVTRVLQQRWRDLFARFVTSDELCREVGSWTLDTVVEHVQTNNEDVNVAATHLMTNADLRDLLLVSDSGKAWLKNDNGLREAATKYMRVQGRAQQLEPLDTNWRYDAFLSYNMADRSDVTKIVSVLQDSEVKIFWDATVEPGTDWEAELDKALQRSRAVVVFAGAGTPESKFQLRETIAAAERSAPLIPVIMDGADPNRLHPELGKRQWIDLRGKELDSETLRPLIRALKY